MKKGTLFEVLKKLILLTFGTLLLLINIFHLESLRFYSGKDST